MLMTNTDSSDELLVFRFGNGIKLLRPDHLNNQSQPVFDSDTRHTVGSILQLPFPVYLEDTEHLTAACNEVCVEEVLTQLA